MHLHAVATVLSALSTASFRAMGTEHTVTVEQEAALEDAVRAARAVIEAVDSACSRFSPDSELTHLNRRAGRGPVAVSHLLGAAIDVALEAAEATAGLVDPTVGASLVDLGYAVTFSALPADGVAAGAVRAPSGWRSVGRDAAKETVELVAGSALDLGATGKAWAADVAARAAADRIGGGVIVACGGDVATAGAPPAGGWRVRVSDGTSGGGSEDVVIFDGGLATSAPGVRAWRRGGQLCTHILDPLTGMPAQTPWAMVSVAASSCAGANSAATAAVILGSDAVDWLSAHGVPARLVSRDGGPVITTPGWPSP